MSDIVPEGEDLRQAIRWISGRRQEAPGTPLSALVEEAAFRFDLSPLDQEFLMGFFRKAKGPVNTDRSG